MSLPIFSNLDSNQILKAAYDQLNGLLGVISVASKSTVTSIPWSASSVIALPANPTRKGFLIYNDSPVDAYIAFAPTASISSFTRKLPAGTYLESGHVIYNGDISYIGSAAGAGALRVTELT